MAQPEAATFSINQRSNWVRLRTLVILRWVAVIGQTAAVVVALHVFNLRLETGLIAMTIGAGVLANILSTFLYPENRRLNEGEGLMMMGFDLLQLGVLLYLSGGLSNPFSLLILAPVTIAANVLPARSTILLGLVAIGIISALTQWHVQMLTATGFPLGLPQLFIFGFWVALVTGVIFIGLYARQVTQEIMSMSEALAATQMALAREQKLTDLGGVVAAAAHELGTPLATIKLVSSELIDELDEGSDLRDDAVLVRDQADRCRDILRSMGRAGKDDKYLQTAPFETVIREAAEPHMERGKIVEFRISSDTDPSHQPVIRRQPEIIHGIRNLVQNAVDFSDSSVRIELSWSDQNLGVRIMDDGGGFSSSVLGRIGDPFVRRRRWQLLDDRRPGYEGMGLGLFIAKTLLERSGASLTFSNGGARALANRSGGAVVNVTWPAESIGVTDRKTQPLGKNERLA
ncbi:sensor histidine kinase RegB [Salibaculum sp.]|uniref:sensor histidine kinase RegB n=1 Tax=Salibaculum sp. TaxID=2855480 RepID=UPI002B4A5A0B|nr:ActS/PrrB/RegB family redox-sensitive histidine kinase [Salibaculum sp.]HKL69114.1 ActS/PrrB/RegB family redox-sensitive histidine kinase [Salibaculum sp.]